MDVVKKIKNYTYSERHCLGEGSFGKVYEGRSDEGLQVAIKKVEQRMISKDPYLRASLESEIHIMKKLSHRNIVRLHDLVMTSNSIYLIMEFCAGGDLKRYCRNRKLGEDEATLILKQICQGFQEIVKKGIIHRDLKPANILVHEGVFKICDFGFAKFFGDSAKMAKTCVGTPIYMSPQILHQQTYSNKTDIWSLGTLYYELMFGKLPFHGVSEDELYRNIVKGPLVVPSCSRPTYNLLKGMLEVDESKRLDWNALFQYFELGSVNDLTMSDGSREDARNGFYRQQNFNERPPTPPAPPRPPVQEQIRPELPLNRKNQASMEKEINDPKMSVGPLHRKPKNPLAFQNMTPVPNPSAENLNRNQPLINLVKEQQKPQIRGSEENPRFFYFVLIELIVNPLSDCPSYPSLVAALYHKTSELYSKIIEKESSPVYKKVLTSELEELRAIEQEIPNSGPDDYRKLAETVVRESRMATVGPVTWVERLLNKNYTYK